MRRRILQLLFALLALSLVAFWPAHDKPRPETVPRVSAPIRWDALPWPLAAGLDAQSRWYAQAASPPVRVKLERRSSSSVEACILARENGGDYGRSSNPTHFGAFQFDRQTWAANGGDPATWGSASPEEQDRVFRNTVEAHGYGAWTRYDGC